MEDEPKPFCVTVATIRAGKTALIVKSTETTGIQQGLPTNFQANSLEEYPQGEGSTPPNTDFDEVALPGY